MKRQLKTGLAITAILGGVMTSPAAADESAESEGNEKLPVLGQAKFTGEMSRNAEAGDAKATAEINSLKRAKSGELTTLLYTIRLDDSSESYPVSAQSRSVPYVYKPVKSISGAVLDTDEKIRYHNLTDEEFYCFCSNTNGDSTPNVIDPGESGAVWGSFLIPKDVNTVTVRIPGFGPVEDIPIK